MSYYYMDNDDDKVRIAEIFDISDEETKSDQQHSRLEVQEQPTQSGNLDWMIQDNGWFDS